MAVYTITSLKFISSRSRSLKINSQYRLFKVFLFSFIRALTQSYNKWQKLSRAFRELNPAPPLVGLGCCRPGRSRDLDNSGTARSAGPGRPRQISKARSFSLTDIVVHHLFFFFKCNLSPNPTHVQR